MGMNRSAPTIFACTLIAASSILCGAGCSSFDRNWRQTVALGQTEATNSIAGRWQGTWESEVTGHHDVLRGLLTRTSDSHYLARFHARYKWALCRFSFAYSVPISVAAEGSTNHLHGEADLGWLAGGVYRYRGTVTASNFVSTYDSKYDHGTFRMSRPEP